MSQLVSKKQFNSSSFVTKIFVLFFGLQLYTASIEAQDTIRTEEIILNHKVIESDTIPHIILKEIPVIPPYKFKNKRQRRRYSKLVRNIKVVLPYARKAGKKINNINTELALIEDKKLRKEFLNDKEDELFQEFEKPLKKLTFSQGRLLIKLINRETGNTTYQLIKEYKGGASAVFWQTIARLFGSNLKAEFDEDGEDKMIEHIITLIDNGLI
ncbi:DUF4294 domain-containing protein [Carboxylicivirga sp. N1Y90]|uniref:DUF4294 domain-containing protein n=1 Tax=Carboxylicivirga fragile TaxID=3417571 RepID=UPI003D325FF6|nr:DUF4294 domain-containing protein [Marinilabiliaceae bacterium N1Y90]